jgi:multicomponent Na+:H+ antiporter subunit G
MSGLLDGISWIALLVGALSCVVSAVGVLRMPDMFTRAHAAGITDTMGAAFILVGLMFQAGPGLVSLKLLTILIFLFVTSPATTHALVKAAYSRGVRAVVAPEDGKP